MYRTVHGNRTRGSTNALSRKISVYGIMGGLAPQMGRQKWLQDYINTRAGGRLDIPSSPYSGLLYMQGQNPKGKYMLSKNPVGSGGVGRMMPNMNCCGAGSMSILKPTRTNMVDVNNSNTGVVTAQQAANDAAMQGVFRNSTNRVM
jgi:hypothetical protein